MKNPYVYSDCIPGMHSLFYMIPQLRKNLGLPLFWHLQEENTASLKAKASDLVVLCEQCKSAADHLYIHYEILRLLLFLATATEHSAVESKHGNILKVLDYIHTHYSETLNIDALAAQVHMSRSQFYKSFKNSSSLTPVEYIEQYRYMQAKRLLSSTAMSVTDIAVQCGYYDATHFAKHFRKHMNISPIEYRKSIKRYDG